MPNGQQAHLLFSYAHGDKNRLLPFHEQLEVRLGWYIWVDKLIERGTAWEESIKNAIDNSYGVIFAITETFVKRPFILDKEIPWAFERFKNIQGVSLFPILFDDVEIPALLKTPYVTHLIDARDGDLERVIKELETPEMLPKARDSGHVFLVDWPRLANFKGRDQALLDLHHKLIGEGGRAGIRTVGVYGMGGIGKTQLAVEYAHRYRFYYPAGVYWINAAQDWKRELAACATRVHQEPKDKTDSDRDGQLVLAFEAYLQTRGDALIVLDNVDDPKEIETRPIAEKLTMSGLCAAAGAKLLLTTRVQTFPANVAAVEISTLGMLDSRAVLLDAWENSERADKPDVPTLDSLAKAVGSLPLALGWLAAALRELPHLSPAELLDELREGGIDAVAGQLQVEGVELGTPAHYEALVGVALDWQIERMKRLESFDLLKLIAAYDEAAIVPEARLMLLSGLQDKGLRKPFRGGLDELQAYSLTETLTDGLRLHPLTGLHLRTKYDAASLLEVGAERLTTAYHDPAALAAQVNARGFTAVLEDMRATLRFVHISSLRELERLLLLVEPTIMQPPEGIGVNLPLDTYLIQTLRQAAYNESEDVLRSACDNWLAKRHSFLIGSGVRYPADHSLLRTLTGHTQLIRGALALLDGRFLSWSDDATLRLWNNEGKALHVLEGHERVIRGALTFYDSRFLSWSDDATLRLWSNEGKALHILEGHTKRVNGALALPDGRFLSWSDDWTLRLWDREGEALRVLEGHTDWIRGALALPDGRFLSWSADATLRLWSNEGETLHALEGHRRWVNGALALPDGRFLSWSDDWTLRLWSGEGDVLRVLEGHESSVDGALVLPDGSILSWAGRVSGFSPDNTLRLWSGEGELMRIFEGHTEGVNGALALPDGRFLSWSDDWTLRLWSGEGEVLRVLEGHESSVDGALVLSNGRFLSWGESNTLLLWNGEGEALRVFEGHTGEVYGALALPDARFLSWTEDATLRLWNADAEALLDSVGHTEEVNGVLTLDDGRFLSWSSDATLRLWSREGEFLHVLDWHTDRVNGALALPDGSILSWSDDATLLLWDREGELVRVFDRHKSSVRGALVLPDRRFLSWSSDATLRLWSGEGKALHILSGHTDRVNGALALLDSRFLSWADDATLRLWSSKGKALHILRGHTRSVRGALALLDGRLLSWAHDEMLLWSADGEAMPLFEGHTFYINGALVLPDGRFLSWSDDGTLRLWSEEGKTLCVFEGHADGVDGALVLPNGCFLSWSADATLRLWSIKGEALHVYDGHTEGVSGVLVLDDGRFLSWSEYDNQTLRLWSNEGDSLGVYVNGANITTVVARGGNKFVFGDSRGRVVFFEVSG